jgi:hypothetical protein
MLTQTGYLGSVGPVFIASNNGYFGPTIIQGEFENSVFQYSPLLHRNTITLQYLVEERNVVGQ